MPILSSFVNASVKAYGFTASTSSAGLYAFTSFTFTNAGITGANGPTLSNCLASYNTTTNPWLTNTAFFNVVTQGYQLWTIPKTGIYRIAIAGAKGGGNNGGNGAFLQGDVSFVQGTKLRIVVGQAGTSGTDGCGASMGGGGGGSFVLVESGQGIYAGAGGGGGGGFVNYGNQPGQASLYALSGGGANSGAAGSINSPPNSDAGGTGTGCVTGGFGGAGMLNNSGSSTAIYNGATGGTNGVAGGFGGGGSTGAYCGGGGGGFLGGGGGGLASCSCSSLGSGGGGSSYTFGANPIQTNGGNTTSIHGYVTFTLL